MTMFVAHTHPAVDRPGYGDRKYRQAAKSSPEHRVARYHRARAAHEAAKEKLAAAEKADRAAFAKATADTPTYDSAYMALLQAKQDEQVAYAARCQAEDDIIDFGPKDFDFAEEAIS